MNALLVAVVLGQWSLSGITSNPSRPKPPPPIIHSTPEAPPVPPSPAPPEREVMHPAVAAALPTIPPLAEWTIVRTDSQGKPFRHWDATQLARYIDGRNAVLAEIAAERAKQELVSNPYRLPTQTATQPTYYAIPQYGGGMPMFGASACANGQCPN